MKPKLTLDDWERFVADIASPDGYRWTMSLDDYFFDVAYRVELNGAELSHEEAARLAQADQAFQEHTVPIDKTLLSGEYWWHFRLPKRAGSELIGQARALGLLPSDAPR